MSLLFQELEIKQHDLFEKERYLEQKEASVEQAIQQQVAQQLEQEKRNLELCVVQEAEIRAKQLLQTSQEWIQTELQRLHLLQKRNDEARKWLNLLAGIVKRAANTTAFFLLWGAIAAFWGWFGGLNTPPAIVCQSQIGWCYQMRIWGLKTAIAKPAASKSQKICKERVCDRQNSKNFHSSPKQQK